jgi:predicted deacylase
VTERHRTIARLAETARADVLATVDGHPIHAFRFGVSDRAAPALLVTGGVHGIERIGTDVAIAYLSALIARLTWDSVFAQTLARCRVLVIPLVNPVGMARGTRANGRGVDLMRNAPPASTGGTPLLGGQRISSRLPWFMGHGEMELEAKTLTEFVEHELFATPFSIALDLHSGFGFDDRLWYPYARTRESPPDLPAIDALARLLDDTLPNHVYKVEQTAQAYTIRGDLWDYLYDRRRAAGSGTLLPITLEMGSWAWGLGRFNPRKQMHRRILRRHVPLLDFLLHAVASHGSWLTRL